MSVYFGFAITSPKHMNSFWPT